MRVWRANVVVVVTVVELRRWLLLAFFAVAFEPVVLRQVGGVDHVVDEELVALGEVAHDSNLVAVMDVEVEPDIGQAAVVQQADCLEDSHALVAREAVRMDFVIDELALDFSPGSFLAELEATSDRVEEDAPHNIILIVHFCR